MRKRFKDYEAESKRQHPRGGQATGSFTTQHAIITMLDDLAEKIDFIMDNTMPVEGKPYAPDGTQLLYNLTKKYEEVQNNKSEDSQG